jgi:hypothetical protein
MGVLDHEMVRQNSPGLQPWVTGDGRSALKVRPTGVLALVVYRPASRAQPRVPLSGHIFQLVDPGLKPWAILSNHFMVKNRSLAVSHAKFGRTQTEKFIGPHFTGNG